MTKISEFLYLDNEPVNVNEVMDYLEARGRGEPKGELRAQALVYATIAGGHHRTGDAVTTEWITHTLRWSRARTAATTAALVKKGLAVRERRMDDVGWRYAYWPLQKRPLPLPPSDP